MTRAAPANPIFEPLGDVAARVRDGMTLAVGGTLFTRMPVRLLAAVCDAGPRDLHYACWGGGLPLEMLLEAGAVSKATLCFSSLDIFGQAKRFQSSRRGREPRAGRVDGACVRAGAQCREAPAAE